MEIRMCEVLGGVYRNIEDEQKVFAAKMMEQDSEYVYQNTYRTGTVTNMDDLLRESVKRYNTGQLLVLSAMGNVLEELLAKWIKTSDSYLPELLEMLSGELKGKTEVMRIPL